jgi:hypothetical protein
MQKIRSTLFLLFFQKNLLLGKISGEAGLKSECKRQDFAAERRVLVAKT